MRSRIPLNVFNSSRTIEANKPNIVNIFKIIIVIGTVTKIFINIINPVNNKFHNFK